MAILVTGAGGQLGLALARRLGPRCIPCDQAMLDITDSIKVQRVIEEAKPSVVVHCAAYTQVDRAESEADRSAATNAAAVAQLTAVCRTLDAVLVQISTDYVFGGDLLRTTPYVETDPPAPLSVYGQTKLSGEQQAALWEKHYIVRTCGLYGHTPRKTNFVEKILELARTRDRLRVVDDQRCSPTYVEHLVDAILFLCDASAFGLYHVVNQGSITWYELATEILFQSGLNTPVEPIRSAEFRAAAPRPTYSVLDTHKYHALGGPTMPGWREALAEYLARRSTTNRS